MTEAAGLVASTDVRPTFDPAAIDPGPRPLPRVQDACASGCTAALRPHPAPRLVAVARSARNAPDFSPRPLYRLPREARALFAAPPRNLRGASALACLAVSIYHEARNQPELGQRAVASVILRRAEVDGRWGDTVCEVVRPVQFSYLAEDLSFAPIRERAAWRKALLIATRALSEGPDPQLAEADHYHVKSLQTEWSREMPVVAEIADHIFFRDPRSLIR